MKKLKKEIWNLMSGISYRERMFAQWEGIDNKLAMKFKSSELRRQLELLIEAQEACFDYIEARTWMNYHLS